MERFVGGCVWVKRDHFLFLFHSGRGMTQEILSVKNSLVV